MKKSELLDWLQAEFQQWEAFLNKIGPARLVQPGVNGDWSMKDMVAHLTGWQPRLIADIQAAQHGEPEPPPPWPVPLQTEAEINAWIYATNKGRSLTEILDESHQVFEQLLTVIGGLPDEVRIERVEPAYHLVWVNGKRFLASEFFDHYHDDHEPDVRAWLAGVEGQPIRPNAS